MTLKKIPSVSAKLHATTLGDKLTIIKCHEKGEKVILIVWSFEMSQTTVSTIVPNKDKLSLTNKDLSLSLKKMQEAFAFIEKGLQIYEDMDLNGQYPSKVMPACHKAFAPYVILKKKNNNRVQGSLDQFLIKKRIKPQQPDSAVNADNPQPSTSVM